MTEKSQVDWFWALVRYSRGLSLVSMKCNHTGTLLLGATTKMLPDRQVLRLQQLQRAFVVAETATSQKYHMTFKVCATFNQLQLIHQVRWCVYDKSTAPFFEWPRKEACWCIWWPQGATVAPPAPVPDCSQRKPCQHILACVQVRPNFTSSSCSVVFLVAFSTDQHPCLPLSPVWMYITSLLPPKSSFFLKVSLLPCALVDYLCQSHSLWWWDFRLQRSCVVM